MRTRAVPVLIAATVLALPFGGCLKRSKMSRSYVLDPIPATEAASPSATAAPTGPLVGIERVSVPGWLDRLQVTGRAADGSIVTDDYSRWGEPLPRGVQRAVAESLVVLLPDRRVVVAPFPPRDVVAHRVELTILDASRQPDGPVLVEARWDVIGPTGDVLVRRRSTHRSTPTALGVAGAVQGLNLAIQALSREIAETLRPLPAPAR
jgi:uncharacterized lipoprotein YmbA